ncbi:hypothetical protein EJ04DRAFT_606464 [Polyplosphaeria fusca]|uniref:Uncharacterized protein n=1 Tax=Polyplosphaeria fusca TaxID=682080 RepID=A0A9P4V7P7_9PLEO|nr:hypothetical protein EJ04DRAFT_606464 [Polyplosphaeria fusca]
MAASRVTFSQWNVAWGDEIGRAVRLYRQVYWPTVCGFGPKGSNRMASSAERRQGIPTRKPVPKAPLPSRDTTPHVYIAVVLASTAAFTWPLRWILSGAPVLFYTILLGQSQRRRVLPHVPLWTIFSTLNLVYALCATSWLFYWVFFALCYPAIIIACLFQFDYAAGKARSIFRALLRDLHFINDKIAFFNLPALEIDTDVSGLFHIRGLTFSLSTFTAVAHGVEVGIKLSDDMELAIQTETVTVSLLRRIDIGNVYANIKGGDWEMTFGTLLPDTHDQDNDSILVSDTSILRTASMALDGAPPIPIKAKTKMTGGKPPEDADTQTVFGTITTLSPDEEKANRQYNGLIDHISSTCTANIAEEALKSAPEDGAESAFVDFGKINDLRAAICAQIHDQPSIPHPPSKSIRLSTLRKTDYPAVKRFLHRLPLLYRLLLGPISYFHPVNIESITAAGSGKWFVHLMQKYFFKHYSDQDPEIRRLQARISAWLADANFAVEMVGINCTAQVPINTVYDIESNFKIGDFMAYRTLPMGINLKQVVHLGGADATLALPSFLLPHHEHIFPKKPTAEDELELEQIIVDNEGTPQEVQAKRALKQLQRDQTNMRIAAHAHLPARFHQDLLNFIAALVKATKVIEADRDFEEIKTLREMSRTGTNLSDSDISIKSDSTIEADPNKGFKSFLRKVDSGFKEAGTKTKEGMRKAGLNTASAVANDRWIAKLVGKILFKLEKAQGDIGYSGNIPLSLQEYRDKAESDNKLLP